MDTLIVGDVQLYTEGLAQILQKQPSITVVGVASDLDSAINAFAHLSPRVVLLDTSMPNAFQAARLIQAIAPDTRIIALSVSEDRKEICACAEAGVAAIVVRHASLDDLLEVMAAAANGEFRCSSRTAAFLLEHVASLAQRCGDAIRDNLLTRRQTHILDLVSCGYSNKEIAAELGIELATVKNHVHQILQRLQVNRRGEAAAIWLRQRNVMTHYLPARKIQHVTRGITAPSPARERNSSAVDG